MASLSPTHATNHRAIFLQAFINLFPSKALYSTLADRFWEESSDHHNSDDEFGILFVYFPIYLVKFRRTEGRGEDGSKRSYVVTARVGCPPAAAGWPSLPFPHFRPLVKVGYVCCCRLDKKTRGPASIAFAVRLCETWPR